MSNDDSKEVLDKIIKSAEIPKECRFALIGPTGSGKSTLVNMLLGGNEAVVRAETTGTYTATEYRVSKDSGNVILVDLPGLDDPRNPDFRAYVQEQMKKSDAALLVLKLSDRALDEIIYTVKELRPTTGLSELPLITVFTHTDKLSKITDINQIGDWESDSSAEAEEIRKFVSARRAEIEDAGLKTKYFIPVAAPSPDSRAFDWNKEQLWQVILNAIPLAQNFAIARTITGPEIRYKTALKVLEIAGNNYHIGVKALAIIYAHDVSMQAREDIIKHFENSIGGVQINSKTFNETIKKLADKNGSSPEAFIIKLFDSLPEGPPIKLPPPIQEKDLEPSKERIKKGWRSWIGRFLHLLPNGIAETLVAIYLTFTDPQTPTWLKLIFAAALLYVINPFDVIPDASPFIGLLDDIGIITAVYQLYKNDVNAHRADAKKWLADN